MQLVEEGLPKKASVYPGKFFESIKMQSVERNFGVAREPLHFIGAEEEEEEEEDEDEEGSGSFTRDRTPFRSCARVIFEHQRWGSL